MEYLEDYSLMIFALQVKTKTITTCIKKEYPCF